MENPKIKLENFDIELRPLTVLIGNHPTENSLLLSYLWASATDDAVFLPASRTCHLYSFPRLRLTRSAELLLRGVGIELYVTPSTVYVKTSSGKRFELMHAPLIIKEIVATVLALSSKEFRYVFIEEPEAHLHPSAQRLMARAIAEAVNSGKYVALTTHSDYLISELNNLIALSNAPNVVKKLGYRDVEVLRPEAVAAYLVKTEDGRAVVERLEVDYTGIPEDEFAKVAEDILRTRNELY
jgi:hypothetical protein